MRDDPRSMTRKAASAAAALGAACVLALGAARATPGAAAPDFAVPDATGKTVKLSDFRGKYVVLEWTNPECPFVRSHYDPKTMQSLQKSWGSRDVVWLAINSTSEQHPEYKTGAEMTAWMSAQGGSPAHVLIDGTSATGRLYAAKTTPQMVVVDPSGKVIYEGAADAKRSANPASHKADESYVQAALAEAKAGKPVTVASTTPYGCSVKY
jgi:hypothetical protein